MNIPAGTRRTEELLVESGRRHLHVSLKEGSRLDLTAVAVTADLSLTVDFEGPDAEFHLAALYVARGEDKSSINVIINHLHSNCISRQLIKGLVADSATGSFTGLIHVAPEAQKTDASLQNRNLQLTDTAHIFTRPQLEIYADDVKCSHGATIGQLDHEAIYYMRQRGITEQVARQMLIRGFINEIIAPIGDNTSRLLEKIDVFGI